MVIGVWSLEWLSHNSQRAYPLTADATRWDKSRTFQIPNDFFVSMHLAVPWQLASSPDQFFVSRVLADSMGYQVMISYRSFDRRDLPVALTVIPVSGFRENSVFVWTGVGEFQEVSGSVVIGSLDNINLQPRGDFAFDLQDGRLEPDAVRPEIRGITSIRVNVGGVESVPISGRIRLVPGRNVRLTPVFEPGKDPMIRIDAISGEGLIEECICQDDLGPPVRSINGVRPVNGRIDILGTDCAVIENKSHSITIKDRCAEPCCGCEELEVLTQALESLGDRIATWENFLKNLEARVTQLDSVVLSSRLGDRSCIPETPCP